jgi:N utilization substance protein A
MQQGGLTQVIEQVSQEKGIDPQVLVEAMKEAILTAARRTFGMNREIEPQFNDKTGMVDLFLYMTVVEAVGDAEREIAADDAKRYGLDADVGEQLGFQIFYLPEDMDKARDQDKDYGDLLNLEQHRRGFGRIAAQTAKQVIIQRVRDAERERVFNEFKDRKGEIITGTVRRFERGNNIIVDLGRSIEAVLPPKEQTPRESYRPGDRIVALLKHIDREARGPQIILSRTDVGLLVKLFEMEVPEIYEGIVRIVAASRVQAVVQELRGEKIDIVPWDRDPARFVCNAIAPAEVVRVVIDETNGSMELVVPDAKLSLAIGRRGQNVRLASQLTGWKLDIVSESRFKQMEEEAMSALARIPGADDDLARAMYRVGFRSLDEVAEAPEAELAQIPGVGEANAASVRERAADALETVRSERLGRAARSSDQLSDRDRLMLVRGVGDRVGDMLDAGGYKSPEEVAREEDTDRLAIRTGLGNQRARAIKDAVAQFLENEWPPIATAQREARAKARAQQHENRARAEAAAEGEAPREPKDPESGESES